MAMRWTDSEASRVSHLARQVRLNLWVIAALTGMGLARVGFTWPAGYRWALAPLGLALVTLLAAARLPWESLILRRSARHLLTAGYAAGIVAQFLFCLPDPDPEIMYAIGVMMIVVAAANTTDVRAGLGLGAGGLAGYVALIAVQPTVHLGLSASIVATLGVVIVLCVLTADNRRIQQAQRNAAERRTAALLENGSDAVLAIADGEVRYVSTSTGRVFGRDAATMDMDDLTVMTHPDDLEPIRQWMAALRASAPGTTSRFESRSRHATGEWLHVEVTGTNHLDDPDIAAVVLSVRDVSTQKELRRELTRQAFEDPVTALPNRVLLRDRIGTAIRRHTRGAGRVSLLLIDLDDFKKINDTLGHLAGDELLRAVARQMSAVVRPSDTLARLGGDEFAVLVEELDDLGLHALAQRLTEAVRMPVRVAGSDLVVTCSVGIASVKAGETADATDDLMRDADLAMYAAKASGRDRVAVFDQSMYATAVAESEARTEIERGLAEHEFVVNYQPIVELPGGLMTGVEALARWQHPTRGLLGPDQFIAHAERTGLIVPLGELVLRTACLEVARWHRDIPGAEGMRVSVNLSARQFSEPDLLDTVRAALTESGIAPDRLVLEITESLLMQDVDATAVTLGELRELGVRIAIDDFGTGYSSLSYLRRFPIDILKIDKAFIDRITVDRDDATLAEAVVGLGQALRLQTVAEGIESADQRAMLSALGCDYGQGYLFARPGTAEDIAELVRRSYE